MRYIRSFIIINYYIMSFGPSIDLSGRLVGNDENGQFLVIWFMKSEGL